MTFVFSLIVEAAHLYVVPASGRGVNLILRLMAEVQSLRDWGGRVEAGPRVPSGMGLNPMPEGTRG